MGLLRELPLLRDGGDGAAMRRLRMQVQRIGPHFRTVLVRGEMGTGKELVARALHGRSMDREGPFVVCHAAALGDVTEIDADEQDSRADEDGVRGTLFLTGLRRCRCRRRSAWCGRSEQKAWVRG